jgi:AcrR family transcriptional regulator
VEDRREQIIDAALQVFSQKGFAGATNKDIARQAGITPGLIYHYFASKEDLLMAVVERHSPLRLINSLPSQVLDLPPEAFLRFMLTHILEIVEGEYFSGLLRVILSETLHGDNEYLRGIASGVFRRGAEFLGHYLEKKMESGELRRGDAQLDAQLLMGSLVSFFMRRHVLRDPLIMRYSHAQIVEHIVQTLLLGMSPR